MKRVLLLMAMALCFSYHALSQEAVPQIAKIKQAFNQKNLSLLDPILSADCSVLGRSGSEFRSTCEALFERLATDSIVSMTLVGTDRRADGVTSYTYDITYSKLGKKKGVFDIDQQGKISRLDYLSTARVVTSTDVRHFRAPSAPSATRPFVRVPFHVADNHLIVFRGELNGVQRNFIFDSGARHSFVNSARLGRKLKFGSAVLHGVNSASTTSLSVADSIDINISGIALNKASILAKDLSYLEPDSTEIAAVIGMDIMGGYDIIYDYANGQLTFINPQSKIRFQGSTITTIPYAKLANDYLPCISVKVGDKELVFGIDCGAATNLIASRYESMASDIHDADLIGIAGDESKSKKGKISFDVAGINFAQQDFFIRDISHLGGDFDGLLGYEFLKTRKMMFKNSTKELVIF